MRISPSSEMLSYLEAVGVLHASAAPAGRAAATPPALAAAVPAPVPAAVGAGRRAHAFWAIAAVPVVTAAIYGLAHFLG